MAYYYVATDGSPTGTGAKDDPVDLTTAVGVSSPLSPGDTAFLRAGTYTGDFVILAGGSGGEHITFRNYPNERATIDGSLTMGETDGSLEYQQVWGLELTNSDTDRGNTGEVLPGDFRDESLTCYAPNSRIINNVIHDGGNSIGHWSAAPDSIVYGNVCYNGGWIDLNRGHGHGLYIQNNNVSTSKTAKHNFFGPQFGRAIAAYGTAASNDITFEENVCTMRYDADYSQLDPGAAVVLGGSGRYDGMIFNDNHVFNGTMQLHYSYQQNGSLTFNDNRAYNRFSTIDSSYLGMVLSVEFWETIRAAGNLVVGGNGGSGRESFQFRQPADQQYNDHIWDTTSYYYHGDGTLPFQDEEGYNWMNFSQWQANMGFDANGTYTAGIPTTNEVFVYPNQYETGRGLIQIWNWEESSTVDVNLSTLGIDDGGLCALRNNFNYYDEAMYFVYDEDNPIISVSMDVEDWSVAQPIGWSYSLFETEPWPKFGSFTVDYYARVVDPVRVVVGSPIT